MPKRERDFKAVEKAVSDLYEALPGASVVIYLDGPRPWMIDVEDGNIRVEVSNEDPAGLSGMKGFTFYLGKTDALTLAAILTGLAPHCEEGKL